MRRSLDSTCSLPTPIRAHAGLPARRRVVVERQHVGVRRCHRRHRWCLRPIAGRHDPASIQGSEGGSSPALSPDGKWVAFFANGKIKKAPIDGEATTIGTARDVRGISWTDDGALVLTENSAAPLQRMPSEGGPAQPLTTLATGERTHRWVDALPGGRRLLFTVGTIASPDSYDAATIEALDTATGERRVVITGAGMARYCGDGRLLYTKGPGLFSVGFDPERLTTSGDPAQVVPAVARDPSTGAAHFACSRDGMLAFVPATSAAEQRHLVWADETGRLEPVNLPPGPHQEVRVSPRRQARRPARWPDRKRRRMDLRVRQRQHSIG